MVLADAVDPAEALLDLHRVPGEIEVHHDVAELQVAPLAGCFRAEQHGGVTAEVGDGLLLGPAREAPVVDGRLQARRRGQS